MGRPKKDKIDIGKTINKALKGGFDLEKFKSSKFGGKTLQYKPQTWIPVSEAIQELIQLPGLPEGQIVLLRGHTDTGKTTLLLEAAASAQKLGKLPVLIITEMKWSWEHAKMMGLEFEEIKDKDGNIKYEGNFIYVDRTQLNSIEDVAAFIWDLLEEQRKGNLPMDLVFLWDSIGSVPCEMSLKSNKNNNEWNAGAMSTQFGNFLNQKIVLSRKEDYPYINTLIAVNKVWTQKALSPMGQPKMMNKNGFAMHYDSALVITFGNVTGPGTSKLKAQKNGKQIEFAKRTNVQVDKNHINGVSGRGRVIMTSHGFIKDTPNEINKYKKAHSHEWAKILGEGKLEIIEEGEVEDENPQISTLLDELNE